MNNFIKKMITICLVMQCNITLFAQKTEVALIDSVMQTAYRRGIFNGNILVAKKGKVIYQHSFGSADGSKSKQLTADLKFDIGSVSKEFNGTAIMILKEQGKLSLDDPLSKYFPEFPDWAKEVKIKQLINYTSGIPLLGGPTADGSDSLIYVNLKKLKSLAFTPGKGYIYNHVNVYLQQRIIEKASGMKYADFVQQNLFLPAGMRHSKIDLPVTSPDMAQAFDNQGRISSYATGVTGWVRLPINDLYLWEKALLSNRIISRESLFELAIAFPDGESSLGAIGFENGKLEWHEHQGSNYNYEAVVYSYMPEAITIVMMTNNQQMKVQSLKTTLMHVLRHEPFTIPKKSLYLTIREKLLDNIDTGLAYYNELKINGQDQYDFSAELRDLLSSGKFLHRRKHTDDAIRVFELAVGLKGSPEDISYGYELLAECYRVKGNRTSALMNYRKALELNPGNKNAENMIKELTNN